MRFTDAGFLGLLQRMSQRDGNVAVKHCCDVAIITLGSYDVRLFGLNSASVRCDRVLVDIFDESRFSNKVYLDKITVELERLRMSVKKG